jgi:nucleoid-associated protein YgaU
MSQFMHTVRFVFGLSMLAGGAVLAEPLASALLAASRNGPPAAESPPPGTQAGLPAAMIGAGGHAIPDARQLDIPGDAAARMGDGGMPLAAAAAAVNPAPWDQFSPQGQFSPPPPPQPPAPLPASGLDWSPAAPALDGTYRSTVEIPPPPLLDVHAPPPLAAGWSVHDVAKPVTASMATQPATVPSAYVVRDGDDLTGIALKVYGHAGAANAIWEANRDGLTDPQLLPIGMTLRLPPSWTLPATPAGQGGAGGLAIEPALGTLQNTGRSRAMAAPQPAGPAARDGSGPFWLQGAGASAPSAMLTAGPGQRSGQESTAAPAASASRPATVRVGMGDSLESIAHRFYGDRSVASRIWLANRDRLRSPDLLVPGVELRLP